VAVSAQRTGKEPPPLICIHRNLLIDKRTCTCLEDIKKRDAAPTPPPPPPKALELSVGRPAVQIARPLEVFEVVSASADG
jgi:hypothetical protein